MTSSPLREPDTRWLRRIAIAVVTALTATLMVVTGSLTAQAAPGDYTVEFTAPASIPVGQAFSYNVTVSTPEASAGTPATGIVLTAQLPEGVVFDTVPSGDTELVSAVSYNAATRVVTFTLRGVTETLSSFVFTVTQNNNTLKDSTTVLDASLTGTPITGGVIPSATASTQVTGALDYRPAKTFNTLTGGNNRDVTYYFNAAMRDQSAISGVFASWGQRLTDTLPAGAVITGTFSEIGGTWTVTGTPATGQTATWVRDNTNYGPAYVNMDSVGRQLGITVRYPASAFPDGSTPPANTVTLDMHERTGDWQTIGTSTAQSPAFTAGLDKRINISKDANSSTLADSYTWGNAQWVASYGVAASYINNLDDETLGSLTLEDTAAQSAANADFFAQSDVYRLATQFNPVLRAANVPYTLEYTTSAGSDWKTYNEALTTGSELRLNTATVGSTGFTEDGYSKYLYLPLGERLTGWRFVVSPGAGDAEIPTSSEIKVITSYVPIAKGQAGPTETYTNTATSSGVLTGGTVLPVVSDSSRPAIADRVPIITQILDRPSTLTVGQPASYGVNISNMDPTRDYADSVMKVVLPVGVFYDAAAGVTRDYATTPTTNVDVPLPGNGLTITTESVTDELGEHQVVVFSFDNLENLREVGQPKLRNEAYGFRYHIPVQVLAPAYNPDATTTSVKTFAYTNDPVFQAVPMGHYPLYYGWDVFNFDPNLDVIAYYSGASTVATSGGLLISKTVRASAEDAWGTSAPVGPDGSDQWEIFVSNALIDPVTDAVIFDRLPQPGDGRDSDFAVTLASAVTGAPAGSTVEYSTDATSATTGTWTTSPAGAVAFRVNVPSIAGGERFTLGFTTTSDPGQQTYGEVATNVVDASVTYHEVARQFASNSARVTAAASPAISLVKKTNGVEYSAAPGAQVAVGSPVVWTYEVTNTGDAPLDQVAIADAFTDGSGATGTLTPTSSVTGVLMPGDTRTFTATDTANTGQYHNVATASAVAVDLTGTVLPEPVAPVTDDSWYVAGETGVSVVKTTNGTEVDSAPGLYLTPGDAVTWDYAVTNTGTLPLTDVVVTDTDATGTRVFTDTISTLAPGETVTLHASGTVISGQYRNTVAVSADNPLGGDALTAADDSYYYGVEAGLSLLKQVSASPTGPWGDDVTISSGDSVYWKFTVTNTGNIDLTDVVLADEHLGHIDPIALLPAGETVERVVQQDDVTKGYLNVATVTVDNPAGPSGPPITADGEATVTVSGTGGLTVTGADGSGWLWALLFLGAGVAALVTARRVRRRS